MTEESKDTPNQELATIETPKTAEPTPVAVQKSGAGKAVWLVVLLQFVLLIGFAAAGTYYYLEVMKAAEVQQNEYKTTSANSNARLDAMKKTLGQVDAEVKEISGDKLADLQKELNTTLANFKTFEQNVNAINKRLKELSPRDEQQWMISQIEYFLEMAQYRLALTGDHQGAALLMDQASIVAAQLRTPDAQALLTALSEDRANLKIEGYWQPELIHAQLNALIEKIDDLSISSYNHEDYDEKPTADIMSSEGMNKLLSSLVRVQKTDSAVKPLLDDTTRKQVEQHIFMLLTEAQLNVMRQNQLGYESSLAQLVKIVKEAFNPNQKQTQFFVNELERLKEVQITRPTTTIEKSQQALRNLITIFEKKKS